MLLSVAAAGLLGLTAMVPTADAQLRYRYGYDPYPGHSRWGHTHNDFDHRRQDERYHRELDRRERTRQYIEREAHRYPLTDWQDRLLHRWLDSERRQDAGEHDQYHHDQEHHDRYHHYGPYRNSYRH
jgi:hypothetical protein